MSVQIVEDKYNKVLICSTTMRAFGDVFSADEDVEAFLEWLPKDARVYSQRYLCKMVGMWRKDPKCIIIT